MGITTLCGPIPPDTKPHPHLETWRPVKLLVVRQRDQEPGA